MNFGLYDLLAQVIPGFLVYLSLLRLFHTNWDKDYVVAATILAFLIGYFVNAIGSWLEKFYFYTWGGKPSTQLLSGQSLNKVKFYHADQAIELLSKESSKKNPSSDELFSIAIRHATGVKDTRIEAFNANYAFSRNILTACILVGIIIYKDYRSHPAYLLAAIPVILIAWQRCKERAYYLAREVLQVYLRLRSVVKDAD